ncbi:hypothetical protein C8J57DRAFT_1511487 [Mycena rebaudengoi]|nr:hypothetical protein C8J57DRAFT_1511487 [Mycena rebaudengoi]
MDIQASLTEAHNPDFIRHILDNRDALPAHLTAAQVIAVFAASVPSTSLPRTASKPNGTFFPCTVSPLITPRASAPSPRRLAGWEIPTPPLPPHLLPLPTSARTRIQMQVRMRGVAVGGADVREDVLTSPNVGDRYKARQ